MAYSLNDDFNRLLSHLAQTIGVGLEELDKNGENVCTIATEDLAVSLINQSGTLIMATNLGNRPSVTLDVSVKNALLRANVLYSETMGGCLGLTEDGVVSFCYHYPMENLAEEKFTAIVESFISSARFWTGRLAELARGEKRTEPASAIGQPFTADQWVKI
ncbi:MAG: type III secretion system chaperone [Deltaproteobacteria bacterium]|nr:type III secretion system chaperone [Deltaproteobacteria bacterium]